MPALLGYFSDLLKIIRVSMLLTDYLGRSGVFAVERSLDSYPVYPNHLELAFRFRVILKSCRLFLSKQTCCRDLNSVSPKFPLGFPGAENNCCQMLSQIQICSDAGNTSHQKRKVRPLIHLIWIVYIGVGDHFEDIICSQKGLFL